MSLNYTAFDAQTDNERGPNALHLGLFRKTIDIVCFFRDKKITARLSLTVMSLVLIRLRIIQQQRCQQLQRECQLQCQQLLNRCR